MRLQPLGHLSVREASYREHEQRRMFIVTYDEHSTAAAVGLLAHGASSANFSFRLVFFLQLLRQIVLDTHLADGVQLRLKPVDMVLLVAEYFFRQFT